MTREELAMRLNGRQYLKETANGVDEMARGSNLLVIYGYSDDLIEIVGGIANELDMYNGGSFRLAPDGGLAVEVEHCDEEVLEKYGLLEAAKERFAKAIKIRCAWDENGYSWFIEPVGIPFAPFDIMEGDEKYCRGIVIDMRDVKGNSND